MEVLDKGSQENYKQMAQSKSARKCKRDGLGLNNHCDAGATLSY
jgi:hypothetical protein